MTHPFPKIEEKIIKYMMWFKKTLSFKDFSQGFPRPPTLNEKASILDFIIMMQVFVGSCH